jgi:hypothetical protein
MYLDHKESAKMTASTQIINFATKNPRKNLPPELRNKRTELLFQNTFLKTYLSSLAAPGIGGNQFEVPGCGIADFIWVGPNGNIDAFEFKMTNWRKGATQASRYRAYAARTILVMPYQAVYPALRFIDSFRLVDLGLWSFDPKSRIITCHHTPAVRQPMDCEASDRANEILSRKRYFRELCETV